MSDKGARSEQEQMKFLCSGYLKYGLNENKIYKRTGMNARKTVAVLISAQLRVA